MPIFLHKSLARHGTLILSKLDLLDLISLSVCIGKQMAASIKLLRPGALLLLTTLLVGLYSAAFAEQHDATKSWEHMRDFGQNDVYALLGRSVGNLEVEYSNRFERCTAFLIENNYILTSAHCFNDDDIDNLPTAATVRFIAFDNRLSEISLDLTLPPARLEDDLDFALFSVNGTVPSNLRPLRILAKEYINEQDGALSLFIIAHTKNNDKYLSITGCRLARGTIYYNKKYLKHSCETDDGFSGAPVFDAETRQVVAIHRAGEISSSTPLRPAVPIAEIAEASDIIREIALVPEAPLSDLDRWNAIKDSEDPEKIEEFIASDPRDAYVNTAKLKLARLREDAIIACHRLTSNIDDVERPAGFKSIPFYDIDFDVAIPACRRAVTFDPQNARLMFQLALALDNSPTGNVEAITWYEKALQTDPHFSVAKCLLSTVYREDDTKNETLAFELALSAANQDDRCGLRNIAIHYDHGIAVEKSPERAFRYYLRAAELGDRGANNTVGKYYRDSRGVKGNDKLALKHFLIAESLGHTGALVNIGRLHEDGRAGLPKSAVTAREYYEAAASLGNRSGKAHLAYFYENGMGGLDTDIDRALLLYSEADGISDWVRKRELGLLGHEETSAERADSILNSLTHKAESGNISAMIALGEIYRDGKGVNASSSTARDWFEKAAEQGNLKAAIYLARLYDRGGSDLDRSYADAEKWYLEAANQGSTLAMHELSWLYFPTRDGDPAHPDWLLWLEKAANLDNSSAQFDLAMAYEEGRRGLYSLERAAFWFQKSADLGNSDAEYFLGNLYSRGDGVEQSTEKAIALWLSSAGNGNINSTFAVAERYREGDLVEQSDEQALYWYKKALEANHPEAPRWLGIFHLDGRATPVDFDRAVSYFKQSINSGDRRSHVHLAWIYEQGAGLEKDPEKAVTHYIAGLEAGQRWVIDRGNDGWDDATLREFQRQLRDRGLYSGKIDGIFGDGTKKAMEALVPS